MFISRAADAFAFSRPDGLLGDLSHSIKARFWLSFYRLSRKRVLSFPFIAFLYSISSTLQFGIKKIMYAYVKYVFEAPKNGLTVVSALSYSIKASTINLILGSAVKFVIWGL